MENYLYHFISLIVFALMNFVPAAGSFYCARYLCRGGRAELFLLTFLIYFFECIAAFGLPGLFGFLSYAVCGGVSMVIGGLLCFLFRRGGQNITPSVPFTFGERILAALCIGWFLTRFYWAASLHSGTDTFLYHFYYPSMWLAEGRIYPVSLLGLGHEYFPIYGEILFGWLMLPYGDDYPSWSDPAHFLPGDGAGETAHSLADVLFASAFTGRGTFVAAFERAQNLYRHRRTSDYMYIAFICGIYPEDVAAMGSYWRGVVMSGVLERSYFR